MLSSLKCRKARRRILDQIEGENLHNASLACHLQNCPACRAYRLEHLRVKEILPLWKAPEPQTGFVSRTMESFLASPKAEEIAKVFPTFPRNILQTSLLAAAGILLLVGFSFLLIPPSTPGSRPDDSASLVNLPPIGYSQMVDPSRDFNLLGLILPSRSTFPLGTIQKK